MSQPVLPRPTETRTAPDASLSPTSDASQASLEAVLAPTGPSNPIAPSDPGAKAPPDDPLIPQRTARRLAGGISDMTMWRWRQAGIIPPPISIRGRNYWRKSVFLAALAQAGSQGHDAVDG